MATRTDIDDLFAELDDDRCQYCDGGSLVRGTFKEAPAVLCENCGTPALRVW
ncbi:MAG: HVO_A0556 family zinc finger protein [Haloferacaceae archaeon]